MKVVGFHNQCPIVEFQYRYVYTYLENTQEGTQMHYSIVLVLVVFIMSDGAKC